MKAFPKHVGFRTGTVRSKELAYVLAEDEDLVEEDQSHTMVLAWDNGEWSKHALPWVAKSACVARSPKEQLVAISGDGDFLIIGQGDLIEGKIRPEADRSKKTGPFRSVNEVGGRAYAVGMDRVLYARTSVEAWSPFDQGLPAGGNLESLHGYSEQDIYAVGWKGEIWHYEGKRWKLAGNPTNVILTAVSCAGDGNVYCVGQKGVIVRGRGNKWEIVEHQLTEGDLWDVEWFDGRLWVSSMSLVYNLVKNELKPVKFGKDEPDTAYHLASAGGWMWSIGQKDIMAFDGHKWTRIE